mmetsp:Transcript_38816/g.86738  ORF Transcript_38816/g.86738 Transcript_38816/m.86738 type:complete len:284 (+) Transcript_38816:481-1332(+)
MPVDRVFTNRVDQRFRVDTPVCCSSKRPFSNFVVIIVIVIVIVVVLGAEEMAASPELRHRPERPCPGGHGHGAREVARLEVLHGGVLQVEHTALRRPRLETVVHFKRVALHGPVRSRFLRLLPNIAVFGLLEEPSEALELLRTERDRGAEQAGVVAFHEYLCVAGGALHVAQLGARDAPPKPRLVEVRVEPQSRVAVLRALLEVAEFLVAQRAVAKRLRVATMRGGRPPVAALGAPCRDVQPARLGVLFNGFLVLFCLEGCVSALPRLLGHLQGRRVEEVLLL